MIGYLGFVLVLSYASDTSLINQVMAQHAGHGGAPASQPEPAKKQPVEQPQEQDEAVEEAPTVEIPLDKQQMIGVKIVAVSIKPLRKAIRTVGRVEYDERKLSTVNIKFEGWIEKLHVDYVGKQVKKGEPLAEIYSPELYATQQEFINLLKWKGLGGDVKDESVGGMLGRDADAILDAARQRLKLWDVTEEQIKSIAESGKPIRTLTIYSPADGTVIQKAALQGMRIMPGEKLFDIADLSTVWIIADIYEYELSLVRPGSTAKITLDSFPGREFTAVIDYVYPVLTSETRTAKVRFSLPNPGGRLKPQMFTNVELKIDMGRRLTIPEDAVIDTGMRQIVYVDKGEGYFEPREVTLGVRAEGMVEVLKGLKAKEKVASAATFLIDSEAKLKGIVK
jgi:Cu(I)/Ag(I) efflux system membrane fusion protein